MKERRTWKNSRSSSRGWDRIADAKGKAGLPSKGLIRLYRGRDLGIFLNPTDIFPNMTSKKDDEDGTEQPVSIIWRNMKKI